MLRPPSYSTRTPIFYLPLRLLVVHAASSAPVARAALHPIIEIRGWRRSRGDDRGEYGANGGIARHGEGVTP